MKKTLSILVFSLTQLAISHSLSAQMASANAEYPELGFPSVQTLPEAEEHNPQVVTMLVNNPAGPNLGSFPTTQNKSGNVPSIEQCSPLQFKYALMLDREVESLTSIALYESIEEWYGTRYLYGGAGKKGIDCSALTGKLYSDAYGITLPRTASLQHAACIKVPLSELREGDLVFFNTRGGISHVGVFLGNGWFVHSSVQQGVTISKLSCDYYKRRFITGGRILNMPE